MTEKVFSRIILWILENIIILWIVGNIIISPHRPFRTHERNIWKHEKKTHIFRGTARNTLKRPLIQNFENSYVRILFLTDALSSPASNVVHFLFHFLLFLIIIITMPSGPHVRTSRAAVHARFLPQYLRR